MESFSAETNSTVPLPQLWIETPKILSLAILGLTFFLGLPGNGLVLWVAVLKMRRTVNVVWFIHLTLADLLCCAALPFSVSQVSQGSWPSSWLLCKLIPSILILNMFASVLLLSAISLDRCLIVLKPVWCQNHRSVRTASAVCSGIWALSLVMCIPEFVYREMYPIGDREICIYSFYLTGYDYAYYPDPTSPAIPHGGGVALADHRANLAPSASSGAFPQPELTQYYQDLDQDLDDTPLPTPMAAITFSRLVVGFLLPFLLMLACYGLVVSRMHCLHRGHVARPHNRTARVAVVVVTVFLVCWAPYHVFAVLTLYANQGAPFQFSVVSWNNVAVALAAANSCLNPFLYALLGKDFRKQAKRSVKNILETAFREDLSPSTSCTPDTADRERKSARKAV